MSLIQILLSLYFTIFGAYLSVVLTRLLIQNGKAVRELGDKMSQQMIQHHQDTVEAIKEMRQDTVEAIKEMHRESEQRHSEVVELLKKGFGDLSRDVIEMREMREAMV